MIFKTLEEARKFYKHYSKLAGFSTKIRNTTRDGDKIKNQLIVCSREGRWKSKISPTLKTNPSTGLNCPARIYVHIMKDVGLWTISKVVLNHSHPYCPDQAEMLKQQRELSMFVRRTIETHEEAEIRPSKTYQSFVAVAGSHCELGDHYIKHAFWANARSRAAFDYFEDVVSFDTTYNTNREIELCITTTIHRWCIWHIMKKIPSKLNGYKGHNEIEKEMRHVVWNSYTKEAFDRNEIDFLRKYSLRGNKWLSEREFDATDFHTVIPCTTKSVIEEQFQHVYTHEKFREVQAQYRSKLNCIIRSMHSTIGFTTYEVIEQVSNSTFNKFVVTYDAVSRDVKCHCLLLESRSILCCHSLSVPSFERVDNVAPKYILECWSKNIKRRHTHIKSSQDEPLQETRNKRFDELVFQSHNICEFAFESKELTGILHRAFDKVMAEMEEYQERSKGKSLLTHKEATLSNVNDLQSPPRVKTRGRPNNRLGSNRKKRSQMP
ncbi:hypothetical protein Ahy_B01g052860 [Arachis hypogaea]|uniref:Protein FAR1-RELATED SEQUENCE n=1 Tax=Arachis hypogaea TaxID=3818 RepID=A0A445AQI6_ARAHY|nr:hypothetical protein Ahy_B01g052860 [Arachis hypogaea]